jgi:hypothetical protein
VTATPLERAEQRRLQAERVRALTNHLRALLDGRMTRAEVQAWTRELWPPGSGQGGPFTSATAASVFDSLWIFVDPRTGREMVRDIELRAYLRWLGEGESFLADNEPLVVLAGDIDGLAARTGTEAVRWWCDGLGWHASLRFSAPARGRPFVVHAALERPTTLDVRKLRSDDWHDALVDLFETLAIDDADTLFIDPHVDLAQLPAWSLWRQDDNGNRFEMARFRSYAKACAHERMFTARGHKQNYWVEQA